MANDQSILRINPIQLVLCLCILLMVGCGKAPLKINLISDKIIYEPEEPIKMQVRVYNDNTDIFGRKKAVVARRGFFNQDFHLLITIIDPSGLPVAKIHPGPAMEPQSPYRSGGRFIVPVEIIAPDAENIFFINDVRGYYRLEEGAAGWYTADVRASLETFKHYTEASTGELFAELFARGNQAYNPLFSNKIRFEILPAVATPEWTIRANVNIVNASGKKNKALENAEVRLYRVSQIPKCDRAFGTEAYREAWNRVRPNRSLLTNSEGKAVFSGIQRDAYLLLARHPEFFGVAITGSLIPKVDGRWQPGKVVEANLSVVH